MTGKPISRRTVLRGLGTAVALPFLEAMLPGSLAASTNTQTERPVRRSTMGQSFPHPVLV